MCSRSLYFSQYAGTNESALPETQGKFVLGEKCRVDKRSASTFLSWHGGWAALIHPTTFDCTRFIKNQSSLIFRANLHEQIYPVPRPNLAPDSPKHRDNPSVKTGR